MTTQQLQPGCNVMHCPLLQMDWSYSQWTGENCPGECRSCSVQQVKDMLDRTSSLGGPLAAATS